MKITKYKHFEIIAGIDHPGTSHFVNDICFKTLQDAKNYINFIRCYSEIK